MRELDVFDKFGRKEKIAILTLSAIHLGNFSFNNDGHEFMRQQKLAEGTMLHPLAYFLISVGQKNITDYTVLIIGK